jgi:hypothetical protein
MRSCYQYVVVWRSFGLVCVLLADATAACTSGSSAVAPKGDAATDGCDVPCYDESEGGCPNGRGIFQYQAPVDGIPCLCARCEICVAPMVRTPEALCLTPTQYRCLDAGGTCQGSGCPGQGGLVCRDTNEFMSCCVGLMGPIAVDGGAAADAGADVATD